MVEAFQKSTTYHITHRFGVTLYLVGALIATVCVVVKSDSAPQIRLAAITTFSRGLTMLEHLAPTFSLARHALVRLRRLIRIVHQIRSRVIEPDLVSQQMIGGEDIFATPQTAESSLTQPSTLAPLTNVRNPGQSFMDPDMQLLQQHLTAPSLPYFNNFDAPISKGFPNDDIDCFFGFDNAFGGNEGMGAPLTPLFGVDSRGLRVNYESGMPTQPAPRG